MPVTKKPLRIWPGVALVVVLFALRFGAPAVLPAGMIIGVMGGLVCGAGVLLWWLLFSRAPWLDRVAAAALMALALFATWRLADRSIAAGAMGLLFPILSVPTLSVAFVAWAVLFGRLPDVPRRAAMAAAILLGCGVWAGVRTGGFTGDFRNDLHWRWTRTPEEKLLASPMAAVPPAPAVPVEPAPPAAAAPPRIPAAPLPEEKDPAPLWPGFRGPARDDVVRGVEIRTDWSASPPLRMWRRPVGPGWSSFAVRGELIYTQEQRGPDEVVACYRLQTGEPVWAHRDRARFWESNGGPGPRGTPAVSHGMVYTFGGTGLVNALRAADGALVWSHNAAQDTGAKLPEWGFASSPLVVGPLVIVAASGRMAAYDLATGERRWSAPARGTSYSSPQRAVIGGVEQVLLLQAAGILSVSPTNGALLWEYAWKGYPIVQPAVTEEGDVLLSVSDSSGIRRLAPARGDSGWTAAERWTSTGLKPYFNDFVVHKRHAYGFDGGILSCIDLQDGARKWKGGRYGHGQLLLAADQDLLLVLAEEGELALVRAAPDQFTEVARTPGIEGKTWNHPVLAGEVLLVRNGEEMAAFRLGR